MRKQYLFIFLICVMLYLLGLIANYKYNEYKIVVFMDEIREENKKISEEIQSAKKKIEKIRTAAYINKALKSQQGLKNPGEQVITLISEEKYNMYTQTWSESIIWNSPINLDPLTNESLLATMTIRQKWIYLILWKDTR